MAGQLVSPGTSVSVTNESFFFPATATTLPVFFIATRTGKTQLNGITPAAGTLESNVVRTVTSMAQALELYGVPYFCRDVYGNEQHGDARNEYGLLALHQFLGTGSRAYVIRADINLDDSPQTFMSLGSPVFTPGSTIFDGIGNGTLTNISVPNSTVKPQNYVITFTTPTAFSVRGSDSGYIGAGNTSSAFISSKVSFTLTPGSTPFSTGDTFVFSTAYQGTKGVGNVGNGTFVGLVPDVNADEQTWTVTVSAGNTFQISGSAGPVNNAGVIGLPYDNNKLNFTLVQGSIPFQPGDTFTINASQVSITSPLGVNDATRRVAIVTALQATIRSNAEVRANLYEYNLIACPGYPEVVDELAALSIDVKEEAFVVGDTPCNKTPEQIAQWALSSDRVYSVNVAYYYPWGLTSNLDGRNVLCAPSGIALRTIAYSDSQSYVWVAPAGVSRGQVTGVSKVGYVTGTLGTGTTFVEANLNDGQRDNLYEYDKNINPIVFFPGRGILIWGQKTSAPAASALDRINVSRGVMHLRRVLRKGSMPFVFEPNDQITRDNLKAAADNTLSDILAKRGLYDFATQCDAGNNTPARIERNELWLDVATDWTKAGEFIYIPIRVVSTGAL